MKGIAPAIAVIVAAAIAAFATVSDAAAHARYASSTPARGEVLSASPAQVELTLTQDVQKVSGTYGMDVFLEPGGGTPSTENVTAGPAEIDDANRSIMRVALQPALAPGRYVVHYHNVSDADGDPFEGAFSFYVGVEPSEADLAADDALAQAEGEETPTPAPDATTTPPDIETPGASSTAVPPGEEGSDGGNGNTTTIIVAIVAIAAGAGLGFVAYRYLRGRSA